MGYIQPLLGIIVFILIAFGMSEERKKIPWRLVLVSIIFQIIIGLLFFKIDFFRDIFSLINNGILVLSDASSAGSQFVFGYIGGAATPFEITDPAKNFIVAFQILPVIILVSALSSLLFYWGILQKLIHVFAKVLSKVLRVDGATALGVASSVFLGIIESPIFIKPYLAKLSRSGLFTLFTAGMSTIAGTVFVLYSSVLSTVITDPAAQLIIASVMSAPAAIMMAQIIIPPDQAVASEINAIDLKSDSSSAFEAIIKGTSEGTSMVIGIAGVLIVLFAFVYLINAILGLNPFGQIELQVLVGYFYYPFCWLMGIPVEDIPYASKLMGTKLVLNEFVAYTQLTAESIKFEKSRIILTYALCGFANFGSLGILIGGLGSLMPDSRELIAQLGLKAIVAGTLATMFTGTIAGLLMTN